LDTLKIGMRENLRIFLAQLVQVFFIGVTIGMQRTIVPPLAEAEFGVPAGSATLIATFIISFGIVKGAMNFISGTLAERYGRRVMLLLGWAFALPIPVIFYAAPSWGWIVAANVLLGINQGFAWSMTVTAKMDIVRGDQRGVATGFNEFAGYSGVALAGIAAGYMASAFGAREAILIMGLVVVLGGLVLGLLWFPETLPFAKAQTANAKALPDGTFAGGENSGRIFSLVTWRDPTLGALTQAGHVEKFVDALIWLLLPLHLAASGASLVQIGWVAGTYGLVWGGSQLWTGPLSDKIGRKIPAVAGMWTCSAGIVALILATTLSAQLAAAAVTGVGMALLYPTLIAAVSDRSHPAWRGRALGVYRFWRDSGYAVGAVLIGGIVDLSGSIAAGFWLTAIAMAGSGLWLALRMQETHPRNG